MEVMNIRIAKRKSSPDKCRVAGCRRGFYAWDGICSCHRMRIWRARNPFRAAYSNLRNNAAQRGVPFQLTFAEFVQFCEQTGYMAKRGNLSPEDCHIDRIKAYLPDGSRGPYALGNIQLLTLSENAKKSHKERQAK